MPATYEPITSQVLSSSAASVTVSGIPSIYTDLIYVISVRSSRSTHAFDYFNISRLNEDSGSNYSFTALIGDSGGAYSYRGTNITSFMAGDDFPADGAPSGIFGTFIMQFMSYSNTNIYKTILSGSGGGRPSNITRSVSTWRSNSAITSITLSALNGSFVSGCTFSLYGVKAA